MNTKETGGQAFPCEVGPASDHHMIQTGDSQWQQPGMTLRQYAAIRLKVPDSGADWLDEMIIKSLRDEIAEKAMHGFFISPPPTMGEINQKGFLDVATFSSWAAYKYADAMLEARAK